MAIKIKKSQLEKLIKEAVQSQLGLQQEETLLPEAAKMTRQHFQLIADVLLRNKFQHPDWYDLVEDFANTLEQTNPGFNKERFLQAAGAND